MKNFLLIANPYSGKRKARVFAEKMKKEIELRGATAEIFLSTGIELFDEFLITLKREGRAWDGIVFFGGDGTLSVGVDSLVKAGITHIPVAVYPVGTVNDFSHCCGLKKKMKPFVDVLMAASVSPCDVATVHNENGEHKCINVVCGGYMTNGAIKYSQKQKALWGKLAYYTRAFFSIFNMKPQQLRFTVNGRVYEGAYFMYLIMNSTGAGGLHKLGPLNEIHDGEFELIAIKKSPYVSLFWTFLCIFRGKHVINKNVFYIKGKEFKVEIIGEENKNFFINDIDGNPSMSLPFSVSVEKQLINVFVKKKSK